MLRNKLSLILLCTFTFFVGAAHAQFRASLRGTVQDSQGAVIPGATVTLIDTDTNHTVVATSDGNGTYIFNALAPAPYRLTVEHQGFQKKVLEHVQIIPEQLNSLDLQLDVGEVQQTVTVSGTTQALDTETATVSGTVTSNQIQHLPSYNRDIFQLAQLAPGVFADGSQGTISYLANGDSSYSKERLEVFGGGSVAVLEDFRRLELVRAGKKRILRSLLRRDKGHRGEWQTFVTAIQTGAESPILLPDILNTMLATFALEESRCIGQPIVVKKFFADGHASDANGLDRAS